MSRRRANWKEPWMEEVYLKIRIGNLAKVSSKSMNVLIIDTDSCVYLGLCIGQATCY